MKKYSNKRLLAMLLAFTMATSVNAEAKIIVNHGNLSDLGFEKRNFEELDDIIKLDLDGINKKLSIEDVIYLGYAYNNIENIWIGAKYNNKFISENLRKDIPEQEREKLEIYYKNLYKTIQSKISPYLKKLYKYASKNELSHYFEHAIYEDDIYYEESCCGKALVTEVALPSYGKGTAEVTISNYEDLPDPFEDYYIRVNMYDFTPYKIFNFYDGDMTIRTKYSDSIKQVTTYNPKSLIEYGILPEDVSPDYEGPLSYKKAKQNQPFNYGWDPKFKNVVEDKKRNKNNIHNVCYSEPQTLKYPLGAVKKRGGLRK